MSDIKETADPALQQSAQESSLHEPTQASAPKTNTAETAEAAVNEAVENQPVAMTTAGQLLRDARTAYGMHIGTLSMALKVPVKKLEALESDDWAHLPDAVFVRALATSVCRYIKTDSAPILALLPQSRGFEGIDQGSKIAIQPSFHTPADSLWKKFSLRLSLPMLVSAAVLLFAALLLIFLPDFAKQQSLKKTEVIEKIEPVTLPEPAATVPVTAASAADASLSNAPSLKTSTEQSPAIAAPSQALVTPAPATQTPILSSKAAQTASAASATATATSADTPKVVASAPTAIAPLPAGTSILRLVAKGQVWIEVKDAKGVVLVQRTLQPKEVINANGTPPLAVVIGRLNEIESVDVRGKPFNLSGLSPDNVARFEVK